MRASQRPSSPQAPLFKRAVPPHATRPRFKGEGQQLYTIDGEPFYGQPDGVNVRGYPSGGGRRLYPAEHLQRGGRTTRQAPPVEAKPAVLSEADPVVALVRAELLER